MNDVCSSSIFDRSSIRQGIFSMVTRHERSISFQITFDDVDASNKLQAQCRHAVGLTKTCFLFLSILSTTSDVNSLTRLMAKAILKFDLTACSAINEYYRDESHVIRPGSLFEQIRQKNLSSDAFVLDKK